MRTGSRVGQAWQLHVGVGGSMILLVIESQATSEGWLWYHRCLVLEPGLSSPGLRGQILDLGEGRNRAWDRADDRERIA